MEPVFATFAIQVRDVDDRWWGHHSGSWEMWLWGTLMMVAWVLIVAAAVWFIARSLRSDQRSSRGRAREILDERYASGDLSTDEYRERCDELR